MALKPVTIRLDEEEYEKLKKALSEQGDPDLNVGYVIRTYIRDLNKAIPDLKKSDYGFRNNLAFIGSFLGHFVRMARFEGMLKGEIGPKTRKKIEDDGKDD